MLDEAKRLMSIGKYNKGTSDVMENLIELLNGGLIKIIRKGGIKDDENEALEAEEAEQSAAFVDHEPEDQTPKKRKSKPTPSKKAKSQTKEITFDANLNMFGGTHPFTGRSWAAAEEEHTNGWLARLLITFTNGTEAPLGDIPSNIANAATLARMPQLFTMLCVIHVFTAIVVEQDVEIKLSTEAYALMQAHVDKLNKKMAGIKNLKGSARVPAITTTTHTTRPCHRCPPPPT